MNVYASGTRKEIGMGIIKIPLQRVSEGNIKNFKVLNSKTLHELNVVKILECHSERMQNDTVFRFQCQIKLDDNDCCCEIQYNLNESNWLLYKIQANADECLHS
jgi:hypothetical protein